MPPKDSEVLVAISSKYKPSMYTLGVKDYKKNGLQGT